MSDQFSTVQQDQAMGVLNEFYDWAIVRGAELANDGEFERAKEWHRKAVVINQLQNHLANYVRDRTACDYCAKPLVSPVASECGYTYCKKHIGVNIHECDACDVLVVDTESLGRLNEYLCEGCYSEGGK